MRHEVNEYNDFNTLVHEKASQYMQKDVSMGEWQTGEDLLATYAASTCIVLAAHNQASGKGLVGHFSSIAEEGEGIHKHQKVFLEAVSAIDDLGKSRSNHIWLGGGSPHIMNGLDEVKADRQFAEIAIRNYLENHDTPIRQTKVQWSKPGKVVDTILDCKTGLLSIDFYPDAMTNATFAKLLGITNPSAG